MTELLAFGAGLLAGAAIQTLRSRRRKAALRNLAFAYRRRP